MLKQYRPCFMLYLLSLDVNLNHHITLEYSNCSYKLVSFCLLKRTSFRQNALINNRERTEFNRYALRMLTKRRAFNRSSNSQAPIPVKWGLQCLLRRHAYNTSTSRNSNYKYQHESTFDGQHLKPVQLESDYGLRCQPYRGNLG